MLTETSTLTTALFTGAAVYVTLVEHPARLTCSTPTAIAGWRPSYRRATIMQASLAVAGSLLAVAAWLNGYGAVWLTAGLLLGSVVPFTLAIMWPTNKHLESPALDASTDEARTLLVHWGNLHACRCALSLVALFLMIFVGG